MVCSVLLPTYPSLAACESGNGQSATLLLACGANATVKNKSGKTPREVATGQAQEVMSIWDSNPVHSYKALLNLCPLYPSVYVLAPALSSTIVTGNVVCSLSFVWPHHTSMAIRVTIHC